MNKTTITLVIFGIISFIILNGFNTSLCENIGLKKDPVGSSDKTSFYYRQNEKPFDFFSNNINENNFYFNDSDSTKNLLEKNHVKKIGVAEREFIVKFKSNIDPDLFSISEKIPKIGINSIDTLNEINNVCSIERLFKDNKKDTTKSLDLQDIYKFKFSNDVDIFDIVEEYKKDLNVEYVEPNYIYHTQNIPNDPFFENQWALDQSNDSDIDAPEAWDIETGDSSVRIAVIDSGVDYSHEDLVDNIWLNENEISDNNVDDDGNGFIDDDKGWDFVDIDTDSYEGHGFELLPYEDYIDPDNDPMDVSGHGTHCAGIIGGVGNNGKGISGVCWNISIIPVRAGFLIIKGGDAYGSLESDDIAEAIHYSVDNGADVISMSFGGSSFSNLINDSVDYAYDNGVVLVAAAGNEDQNVEYFPAGLEKVIAVAASDENDERASFSNYGSWVDVAAPGVNIISTLPNNEYGEKSGTSMACPYISGIIGLILSKKSNFTKDEVLTILHSSTDPVSSTKYIGIGRINVFKAIQREISPIVRLDPSLDGAIVNGLVDVYGTANGSSFHNYTLYAGKGVYPESWLNIKNSSNTVFKDVLTFWDSSLVEDGSTNLRLQIVDVNGQISEDRIFCTVSNINIVRPLNNDVFRLGDFIEINGTLWKSNFKKFSIEYQKAWVYVIPDKWYDEGVTSIDNGSHTIDDGILGRWDTSFLTEKGYYRLRINITLNNSENEYFNLGRIYLDPSIKKGWPQRISWKGGWAGSIDPVVTDINKDGINEMIVYSGGSPPRIFIYGANGELINQWDVNVTKDNGEPLLPGGNIEFPTVVDINGDGYKEIIVSGWKKIFVYKYNGSLLRTILLYECLDLSSSPSAVVTADLDNNGDINLIRKFCPTSDLRYRCLAVCDSNGTMLNNWPQVTYFHETPILDIGRSSSPSLGNFDDDNDKEIVVCDDIFKVVNNSPVYKGVIKLYNVNGTLMEGFPLSINGFLKTPAVGDINNDGYDEIVISYGNGLCVIDRYGNICSNSFQINKSGFISAPILADFNNDAYLEIIVTNLDYVYVFDYTGEILPGWPQPVYGDKGNSPIIADVNGDYSADIIVKVEGKGIYAWNINGTCINVFPKITESSIPFFTGIPSPVIADIDNDGNTELIATSNYDSTGQDNKYRGSIYVWELNHRTSPSTMHWPMPHHDPSHTNQYEKLKKDKFSPAIEIIKPEKALYIFNIKIRSFLSRNTLIIGKINIEVNVSDDDSGVNYVELYIDENLKYNSSNPHFSYQWNRGRLKLFNHKHRIKIVAYDQAGNTKTQEMKVKRFL